MKRFPRFHNRFSCLFFRGAAKISLELKLYITIMYSFHHDHLYRKRPVWLECVVCLGLAWYISAAFSYLMTAMPSLGSKFLFKSAWVDWILDLS